ncbi:MAG: UDP-N-acetylmuramoyl-L-alanyl-D-glutamate--2,6-diaminopimelate ligase [Solirubrobacteraceae bacterium]|nr:UDP-N-acetylmuramoyl-L-alanyl-D-glutamate--2,6-diaminopimelate ligase [Solirubrobacteraceae bacterium]
MDLGELTGDATLAGTEISDLVYSSRDASPGSLFFCVRGFTADGHEFAADAVSRGAAALVCERPLGLGVPEFIVDDARAAMPALARRFFRDPSRDVEVIGITGTNGKTTTAYLVRQILEATGRPCGLLGTVAWIVGGVETAAVRTTPEAIDLVRALRTMADAGERACAIEISSHALELGRADEVAFAAAVFTNLTQDHLDFHATMEDYFAAKRLLFESEPGVAIVNIDDAYGRRLAADFDSVSYSAEGAIDADYRASDVEFDATGSRFTCTHAGGEIRASVRLPGLFNVANALAALATVIELGISPVKAVEALAQATGAPGRFEPVAGDHDFGVFVDYAHTPDSIENVLRAAQHLPHNRVISVVGAGGDRDRTKRPLMGAAAAAASDVVYVTSDNPRSEEPSSIIEEVLAGARPAAEASGARVEDEVDRRAAIERAVAEAEAGDIVFVFGKGHEQGQEFADGRKIPFDDATVVRESLAQQA